MLRALNDHGVRYIVIGGIAATLQKSPYPTTDLDICPERSDANDGALDAAVEAMHGFRRAVLGLSERYPKDEVWEFETDHGNLHVEFRPSGTEGFEDLARRAIQMQITSVPVSVSHLADVVRSMEAAHRAKDAGKISTLRKIVERGQEHG